VTKRYYYNLSFLLGIFLGLYFFSANLIDHASAKVCDGNNYICVSTGELSSAKKGMKVPITAESTQALLNYLHENDSYSRVYVRLMILTDSQVSQGLSTEAELNSVTKKGWWVNASDVSPVSNTVNWDTSGTAIDTDSSSHHVWIKAFNTSGSEPYPEIAKAIINFKITATDTGDGGGGGTTTPSGSGGAASAGNVKLPTSQVKTLPDLFNRFILLFQYAVWVAAMIGFIYGGATMMEASKNPDAAAKGKKFILYSVVGMILAIFTQVIINGAISQFTILFGK
jgi:hypothetical protein